MRVTDKAGTHYLKMGEDKIPIELVADYSNIYGVFTRKPRYFAIDLEELIRKKCKRYEWNQAELRYLDKLGRPYYHTRVRFSKKSDDNLVYWYRYIFLMRMIDCVAKLSHCSRKFALKHGEFYQDEKGGLLIFTVDWGVLGMIAPEIEVL